MDNVRKVGWRIMWAKYVRGKAVVHVDMGTAGEMRLAGKPDQTIDDLVCRLDELAAWEIEASS